MWRAFAVTGALCLVSCSRPSQQTQRPEVVAPPVEAVQARFGALPLVERVTGTVWAENQIALYPEITARIAAVHVNSGDAVQRGQALVTLNDEQYREQARQAEAGHRIAEAQVRQARAELAELEAQARRTRSLGARDLVTELELETVSAQLESARADVDLAEAQLEQAAATLAEQRDLLAKTIVRAPIAGVVGQRNAELGMQASPSTRLFTIGNLERVLVRVNITDNMLRYIEPGQPVRIPLVLAGGGDDMLQATLTRISPFLNEVTRSTEAEIEIDNSERYLRPGMFVPVDILHGQSRQATLVPTSALFTDPNTGREGVFVVGAPVPPPADAAPANPAAAEGPGSPPLSDPLPVEFRTINVIARGQMEVAVDALPPDAWVVTLGQDLLSTGRNQARVRPVTWDHVMALQGLKREDLLEDVLHRPAAATEG